MKIIHKYGDLLEAPEKYILHGCNAQGVMGAGVARLIKQKWPTAYLVYIASRQHNGMRLGVVTYAEQDDGKVIFNGITQEFFARQPGECCVSYRAIEEVICAVNSYFEHKSFQSVAMPKIGAGLGGGDWDLIETIIEHNSKNFQPVVYEL